jgi:TolA-binding protein
MTATQRIFAPVVCLLLLGVPTAVAQMPPEQAAELLLASGRRAYNERNYPFAAGRFREYLSRFGNQRDAAAARYGLALCLLNGPEKDYNAAAEQLQPLAGNKEFADHPFVLYYLGLARRGQGVRELAQADTRPQEAAARRAAAQQRFDEAAKQFAEALAAFTARVPAAPAKEPQPDAEWAARSRCDLAEMQLRTLKPREAQATTAGFLKDPVLRGSRYHGLGLYYHGFASLLLKDYVAAGRSLNPLTPFTDPVFGTHARYLLARVHHLTDERPEAAGHYEGVVAGYARQKQAAAEALKRPDALKNDADEKARLEALVREPPPDYVVRATFYLGILHYEDGRFAEALTRFTDFAKQFPKSPLLADVQLQQGICQVQLKQFAEAVRVLPPLAEREPRLADLALFWTARAQVGAADPNNAAARGQALKTATETLRRAAEKAQQLAASDPEARRQRGEILLELGDTQQLAGRHREAAATYTQVLNEKLLSQRDEELLQRQADALHLAGEYAESDRVCQRFQQTYPRSLLLPAVLFRYAENACFLAQAAEKNPNLPNRAQELARLHDEAAKRYQVVVDRFPESANVNLARYGLALVAYRKGEIEKARKILEAIPQADRTGDLAVVSYALADCLLRSAPVKADDALAAGRMEEELRRAAELLDAFVSAQPGNERVPDALLKLGLCQQRLANLLAQPPDKAKALAAARAAYERLMQQFPKHALQPQAVFERAKCLALAGDKQGAVNELQRFTRDPLKGAPPAPMAVLHLAVLLRGQKKAAEAAAVLGKCREQHEQALGRDPERAGWVPLLQYHHGLTLKEAGKLAEARGVFEPLARQMPERPEAAEAALRWGQCLKEEGLAKMEAGRKARAAARKPEETQAAQRTLDEALRLVQEAVKYLEDRAEQLKAKQPAGEVRARMLYEAAWGYRALAEADGKGPHEQKARAQYEALIAAAPELPLAADARFELAELLSDRGEHDAAVKLLADALDKEPSPDLTEKIRLRLGVCHAARKDTAAALAQFQIVAQNPKSSLAGQAHYRAGECLLQAGQWAEAVKHLGRFRDQAPYNNLPGLTDRALLRLGHALAHLNQWDASRQAHEQVVGRFGNGPWALEARYGIGWAWQNQRQFDQAVNAYAQVAAAATTEIAAKAQLQIGLCRLEQKRFAEAVAALLVVPFTYDYPELNAVALCEAAQACVELKQREHAERLLQRVLREHPKSKWAEVARERLEKLKRG